MKQLSLEDFNGILNGEKLSVILCSAVWCAACRAVTPILEQVTIEYDNVSFGKIDVDKLSDIASQYGVSSIPALLFFKDGKLLEKHVGALPKTAIKRKVDSYL